MPKFVVYEIWTRGRVVEAADMSEAYKVGEPSDGIASAAVALGFNFANWHAVAVEPESEPEKTPAKQVRKRRTRKPAPMVATATADETTVAILD